jgi:hypothetical protein
LTGSAAKAMPETKAKPKAAMMTHVNSEKDDSGTKNTAQFCAVHN